MFVRLFGAAVPNITERVCDQTRPDIFPGQHLGQQKTVI